MNLGNIVIPCPLILETNLLNVGMYLLFHLNLLIFALLLGFYGFRKLILKKGVSKAYKYILFGSLILGVLVYAGNFAYVMSEISADRCTSAKGWFPVIY